MAIDLSNLSKAALDCLHDSGWNETTRFEVDLSFPNGREDRVYVSPHATEIWERFGDLWLKYPTRWSPGRFDLWKFCGRWAGADSLCEMYERVLGVPFTFIGEDGDDGLGLYVDANGAVYSADLLRSGTVWKYGDDIIEALNCLCEQRPPKNIQVADDVIREQIRILTEQGQERQRERIWAETFWKYHRHDAAGQ